MHAPFVTCRPSFPLGFKLGDFPPVQRALHVDNAIESYLLDRTTDSELLLIRAREQDVKGFRRWWEILGPDILIELPSASLGKELSVIRLRGQWWPDKRIDSIAEDQWRPLLLGTLNLLKIARGSGLRPEFNSSLAWFSEEKSVCFPLCAIDAADFANARVLRDLAATIISSSTGIDVRDVALGRQPLKSWNQCIPGPLFDALARCLQNEGQGETWCLEEVEDRISGGSDKFASAPQLRKIDKEGGLSQVAGMNDLKDWLQREVLGPLQNPELYEKYRIGIPNGILFYGPPGCGKTYIARRLAEELGYFFQEIKPSDVASPYIHSTVLRIRELFDVAIEKAPALLFIDEFDAFVPARSELGGHQQYKAEEVNEFLGTLEGIASRKVLVIAATNEPEKIDPAIRRSGRFDKLVFISPPDSQARISMLQHHLAGRPLESKIDLAGLAMVLDGYSASDVKLLVDEAARAALQLDLPISTEMLLTAMQRVPPSISAHECERYTSFRARG